MPLRYREQDLRTTWWGTYTSPIGPTTTYYDKTDGYRRTCYDFIGNRSIFPPYEWNANDFSLMEEHTFYPILTCTSPSGHIWNEQPIGFRPGTWDPRTWYPELTLLDRSNMAWEILAKTNPSRPHVSVPTAVGELKDLPGLVKGYGVGLLKALGSKGASLKKLVSADPTLAKAVAGGYLTWKWAVKPMISDLRKLLNFTKAVDNRIVELMRLRAGSTIRKRVKLGEGKGSAGQGIYTVESKSGGGLSCTFVENHSYKAWGSAQWKLLPDSQLPKLGYGPLRQLARELALGITSHEALATAWELTPWSWLTDWFANVGDVIAATNNSVGCTWSNICYMRTSESITSSHSFTGDQWLLDGLKGQTYILIQKRKERYVVSPVLPLPFPQLPIITNGQWSILAALAAQRLK